MAKNKKEDTGETASGLYKSISDHGLKLIDAKLQNDLALESVFSDLVSTKDTQSDPGKIEETLKKVRGEKGLKIGDIIAAVTFARALDDERSGDGEMKINVYIEK